MTTIDLIDIEPINESTAVAAGKAILAAMPTEGDLMIGDNDLSETQWGEMADYLNRRGVLLRYDHDAGYPVARHAA